MGDSLITVFVIFIAVILMLLFPLLVLAENSERITQLASQTITAEFVDKITTAGIMRKEDYDAFISRLHHTGSTFEVQLEVRHVDENPNRNATIISPETSGGNLSYSVFTSSILFQMNMDGAYIFKQGDTVVVTIRNTNRTIAQLVREIFFPASGTRDYQVGASFSGMVVNNGRF